MSISPQATHRLGEGVELHLGTAEPSRHVLSVEEWLYAWSEASNAIVWVFPHRGPETQAYQKYIISHFKSTARQYHPRILLLDKRIRALVASRRDLTLASLTEFAKAERSFLSPIGADYASTSAPSLGSSKARRNDDPCRRFNNGSCPSTASQCRYAHVCLLCKKPGYVASSCKPDRSG
jgi:hypothetical protein